MTVLDLINTDSIDFHKQNNWFGVDFLYGVIGIRVVELQGYYDHVLDKNSGLVEYVFLDYYKGKSYSLSKIL